MRATCLAGALVILLGLAGCGTGKEAVMPDVTGKKLDVAKSAIQDAGFDEDVKVDGGGIFGVIDESNWEVCEQSPASGQAITGSPRLTVDRSCDNGIAKSSDTPSAMPSKSPEAGVSESSTPGQVLTAKNNKDFAALLTVSDNCDHTIKEFVAKYGDRTVEFDGSIGNMMKHGDDDTRYDILVSPGNKGPQSTVGPSFKFEDVNVFDLNLTGAHVPDTIGEGDRFRFVAEISGYNPKSCLLFLDPVSTKVR